MAKIIGVKFKNTAKVYYFAPANDTDVYEEKSGVVVETAKGLEFGTVVFGVKEVPDSEIVHPLKPVLRKATEKQNCHLSPFCYSDMFLFFCVGDCDEKKRKREKVFEKYILPYWDGKCGERIKEDILNSLWAFRASFIIKHCSTYEDMDQWEYDSAVKSLEHAQCQECENLNPLVKALISNIDEFVEDAIDADGRGHFISYYDGKENEQDGFYIYRIN